MREITILLFVGLCFPALTACGPRVTAVSEDSCYQIDGEEVIYTCSGKPAEVKTESTPGYDGPNNPKALNLYRPGRFENLTGW